MDPTICRAVEDRFTEFSPPSRFPVYLLAKNLKDNMSYSSYEDLAMSNIKRELSETCYSFFSTLSSPTRLAILEFLMDGPRNVTEISEALQQEQSMISHNLRTLLQCGFVSVKRNGKKRIYSMNKEIMESLFKIINYHVENYCALKGNCPKGVSGGEEGD